MRDLGSLKLEKRNGKHLSAEERRYRREVVLKLRKEEKSIREIAGYLNLANSTISKIIRGLVEEGLVEKKSFNPVGFVCKQDNSCFKNIVRMVKARTSLRKIGFELGLSYERVRQLKKMIAEVYGEEIFKSDERLLTVLEVAEKIGEPRCLITEICFKDVIPCWKRGEGRRSSYLIFLDSETQKKIQKYIKDNYYKVCPVCGREFRVNRKYRFYCSRRCLKKAPRKTCYKVKANENNLRGWHLELWRALQNYPLPKDEEWIFIREAFERSALSLMQIRWLYYRQVFRVRLYPSKKRILQIPLSELKIADKIWRAEKAKEKTKKQQ